MNRITITATINTPIQRVWDYWTTPEHITQWNHASLDWECPYAENDLHVGGKFLSRMSAKDGSVSFDFSGTYTDIVPLSKIAYTADDDRKMESYFAVHDNVTEVTTTFDPENTNPEEMQRDGWQSILNNFKIYTESHTN